MATLRRSVIWFALVLLGGTKSPCQMVYDNFDDNVTEFFKWAPASVETVVSETNRRLEVTVPASASNPWGGYRSLMRLRGDFDIRADYRLLDWPSENGVRVGLAAELIGVPGTLGIAERVSFGPPGDFPNYPREVYLAHFGCTVSGVTRTSHGSGTLRLVRRGRVLEAYYLGDGGWVLIHSAATTLEDVRIVVAAWSEARNFAKKFVRVAFDNIVVAKGQQVWPSCSEDPKGAEPPRLINSLVDRAGNRFDWYCEAVSGAAPEFRVYFLPPFGAKRMIARCPWTRGLNVSYSTGVDGKVLNVYWRSMEPGTEQGYEGLQDWTGYMFDVPKQTLILEWWWSRDGPGGVFEDVRIKWFQNEDPMKFDPPAGSPAMTVEPFIPCDVDGDGVCTRLDYAALIGVMGQCVGAANFNVLADADHDGCVTANDANAILNAGLSTMASGLIGHWKLNGNVLDSHRRGNHGQEVGAPAYAQGKFGAAALLDGVDDCIRVESTAALDTWHSTKQLTLEGWVYPTKLDGTMAVFGKGDRYYSGSTLLQEEEFQIYIEGSGGEGRLVAQFNDNCDKTDTSYLQKRIYSQSRLRANTWHHVAFVWQAGVIRLYLDGALQGEVAGIRGSCSFGQELLLGHIKNAMAPQQFFQGVIDEVRLWDVARSPDDIKADMNRELPPQDIRIPAATFRDASGAIRLARHGETTLWYAGGVFAGDPAAAQNLNGDTFAAARDTLGSLWANLFNATAKTWGAWTLAGGRVQGTPSVAVTPDGTAYIAARDSWNSYWLTNYTPGAGFGPWIYLAGIFSTDPVMCAAPDGSLYIIGKDNWNSLWSGRYVPGSGFQNWVWGMGIVKGKPSVACGTDGAAYVAVRDMWDSLWMARVLGNTWTGWHWGQGIMSADPQAASAGGGVIYAVMRDPWGGTWYRGFSEGTGANWQNWVFTGGILQDFSPAGVAGELYIAGRDATNGLWWYRATTGWTWADNVGIAAGPLAAAPR